MLPRRFPSPTLLNSQTRCKTRIAFKNKAGSVLPDYQYVDHGRPERPTKDGQPRPPRMPKALKATHPSRIPLADDKLRALVSLYHASSSFITPETLDQAIDEAFIHSKTNALGDHIIGMDTEEQSFFDLQEEMLERARSEATSAEWAQSSPDRMTDRERKVFAALYGTDESGNAGLGALEDEQSERAGKSS